MKKIATLITLVTTLSIYGQSIVNGNFDIGNSSWGCNPEVNGETAYGGSSSNKVAEVDAEAGLCQTITGFVPGSLYRLSFGCSRRTNCGPALQTMNVSMGGLFTTSISRNNTAFGFAPEAIYFVPSSASHTLTYTGTVTGTCNLLVDNIQIALISALPVELSSFSASCDGKTVTAGWVTESEARSDYFTLEQSADGNSWIPLADVAAKHFSQSNQSYSYTHTLPAGTGAGTYYYRLSLTDLDGEQKVLSIVAAECRNDVVMVYPDPVVDFLTVNTSPENLQGIYDMSGRLVNVEIANVTAKSFQLDFSAFSPGVYSLRIAGAVYRIEKD